MKKISSCFVALCLGGYFCLFALCLGIILPLVSIAEVPPPPSDARVVNITQAPYFANNTGVAPIDTIFQQVLTDQLGTNSGGVKAYDKSLVIYFPAGTYKINDTLKFQVPGQTDLTNQHLGWRAHVTIQGQSKDGTNATIFTINAANFNNPGAPKPVFYTASHVPPGTGTFNLTACEGNTGFNNCFYDLTINTGTAAGAIGIDYLANNEAAIRNVNITGSASGTRGHTGIQMKRRYPGPLLFKNLAITGYQYAIACNQDEYSFTLENVTFDSCDHGIYNTGGGTIPAATFGRAATWNIRNLVTTNIKNASIKSFAEGGGLTNQGALITLLGANFGRAAGGTAVDAIDSDAVVYLREAAISAGYTNLIKERGVSLNKSVVKEYFSHGVKKLFYSPNSSLNLIVRETPEFEDYNYTNWQKVSVTGDQWSQTADNTAAIQTAFDSGKHTIYFPRGRYNISGTINVPSSVKRIVGYRSILQINSNITSQPGYNDWNNSNPFPLFKISGGPGGQLLIVEGLSGSLNPSGDPNYAAGVTWFSHEDLRFVVLKDCWFLGYPTITYRTKVPSGSMVGQLFVENTMTGRMQFNSSQNVWGRQFNVEPRPLATPSAYPNILNKGGLLWVFGLKTENPHQILKTTDGGMSEILGGYHFPVQATDATKPAYEALNSHQSINYATHAYSASEEYTKHIYEDRGDSTTPAAVLSSDSARLLPRGTSAIDHIMPFFSGVFVSPAGLVKGGKFSHSLGLDNQGRLWAWGENGDRQLGYNSGSFNVKIPNLAFAPAPPSQVVAFSGGSWHTLAADNSGSLWAWGRNENGQIGNGTQDGTDIITPTQITLNGIKKIKAVAAGSTHSVALDMDGFVWTWGNNGSWQLGQNPPDTTRPTKKTDLSNVVAIACGTNHTVALRKDGSVATWGANGWGQLGNGNTSPTTSMVNVAGLFRIVAIDAGANCTVALKEDGTVYAWGYNGSAASGEANADILSVNQPASAAITAPMQVIDKDVGSTVPLGNVAAIAVGGTHVVALKRNGSVWAWGRNNKGQLAMNPITTPYRGRPAQISLGGSVTLATSVGAGEEYTLILKRDGNVSACGENGSGQLGNNSTTDSATLVPVSTSTGMNLLN